MPKLSRHVRSLKSIATLLNSISLPRSWLPIFVIALKSAPAYTLNVYTPTDLHGMASSAQSHRAETPGAESGPVLGVGRQLQSEVTIRETNHRNAIVGYCDTWWASRQHGDRQCIDAIVITESMVSVSCRRQWHVHWQWIDDKCPSQEDNNSDTKAAVYAL